METQELQQFLNIKSNKFYWKVFSSNGHKLWQASINYFTVKKKKKEEEISDPSFSAKNTVAGRGADMEGKIFSALSQPDQIQDGHRNLISLQFSNAHL